jgi:hypothetical protein
LDFAEAPQPLVQQLAPLRYSEQKPVPVWVWILLGGGVLLAVIVLMVVLMMGG